MPNEADACQTYIVPNLHTSGWDDEYITEQMMLISGCIMSVLDRLYLFPQKIFVCAS